eukprot:TRINITY_DN2251_c0_g2_i3.p1 TRINITY_DN2251_c0_g2~~TRINITY_DN2251_c0_g2_i3.p1  ORF type:complete len:497 (+),score=112.13 TRINITY_DN2251_c0_g2_i3:121-1491(+)
MDTNAQKIRGTVGHAVLRYNSGGSIIISAGHWIELNKLETSIDKIEEVAAQYGDEYCAELDFLKDPNVPMEEKKRKMAEMSKLFVQQMPSVKSKQVAVEVGEAGEKKQVMKTLSTGFYEFLIPLAEKKLAQISLPLEKPFLIFGDSSASMGVCVRTSTIIASFVSCITDTKLFFFNYMAYEPKTQPKKINDVIEIALTTKAIGETCPAACLDDIYKKKKKVKSIMIVTDEIENIPFTTKEGATYFAQLFYRYYTEVYPAKLVMVSFLQNPKLFHTGQMYKALVAMGIKPVVFSMHLKRPDLTKLDKLVGILSLETSAFLDFVERVATDAQAGGFQAALTALDKRVEAQEEEGEEQEEEETGEGIVFRMKMELDEVLKNEEIPKELLCPVTHEIMTEPVVAADGYTYEKSAITKWFADKSNSPMTNQTLTSTVLYPNHSIKAEIIAYLEKLKAKGKK